MHDADLLRQTYNYDANTGRFTWRTTPPKSKKGFAIPGTDAGTVDNRRGNLLLRFGHKQYPASRLAWLYQTGEWPEGQVLYRDPGLPLPARDRFDNLRLAADKAELTAEAVRELFDYDPGTGIMAWRTARKGVAAGSVAGSIKNVRDAAAYAYVRIDGVDYGIPRLAWLHAHGVWPSARLTFRNGDRHDTRLENLVEGEFEHGTRQNPTISNGERAARRATTYRKNDLRRKFDLSPEEYRARSEAQNHQCAICGREETATRKGKLKVLAVDHHHATGALRDLLCAACNMMLGMAQDDPTRLRAAADYLERHAAMAAESEAA